MDFKICRVCGRSIVFLRTKNDKLIPVDARTVRASDELFDATRHVSHFATCTKPEAFRRPAGPRPIQPRDALAQIADEWKATANALPAVRLKQVLSNGVRLSFYRDGDTYRLAIGRKGVYPADSEVTACLLAFGIPPSTKGSNDSAEDFKLIRLHWPAPKQMALPIDEDNKEVMTSNEMQLS